MARTPDTKSASTWRRRVQWAGLVAGPVLAAACYLLLPREYQDVEGELASFTPAGRATLAVMVWMAVWWLTETVHISATALLPLVLFPPLGVATMKEAAAPFAHPLIFLFMGGFLLALSMERWGLGKRVSLMILGLVGTRPTYMVGGFMLATAVFSGFVSNTATTAMMLPIAASVIRIVRKEPAEGDDEAGTGQAETGQTAPAQPVGRAGMDNFSPCLMLGIAYSASIGGLATIIGSPPNALLVGFVRDSIGPAYRLDISFAKWMLIALPLTALFLPIVFLMLTRVLSPIPREPIAGGRDLIRSELRGLGRVNRGERVTFVVFLLTAGLWMTRPWLGTLELSIGPDVIRPFAGLTDAGIAMSGAFVLFVIPTDIRNRQFVMDWQAAQRLPWGILVLFGGGLSLAAAVQANGVAEFLGSRAGLLERVSPVVLVLAVTGGTIVLTELTSNTATTATLLPLLAAVAPGLGVHPYLLIFPATLAASCAFMLPVATPPNAIVFGSGHVTLPHMVKAGIWLNLIGILLITGLTILVVCPMLGVEP